MMSTVLQTSPIVPPSEGSPEDRSSMLDGGRINLLNWNIQKLSRKNWFQDLRRFARGVDLALIQEASLDERFLESLRHVQGRSFAAGYVSRGRETGVMTFSRVAPDMEHGLASLEPYLRTPKATAVSQYPIAGYDQPLLVINLHAVNFCWELEPYRQQLKTIVERVENHQGPVIVAGDFNAWRPQRLLLVHEMAEQLGLDEVVFEIDQRKKRFGHHLDFIFTRGLSTLSAETHKVRSSDHNPMLASFSL